MGAEGCCRTRVERIRSANECSNRLSSKGRKVVPCPVRRRPRTSAARASGPPGVVRRASHLDELAQSLRREGVPVVGNELEAAQQFVPPVKYFAARRRISGPVSSFVVSARNRAFSASNAAIHGRGASS